MVCPRLSRGSAEAHCASPRLFGSTPWLGRTRFMRAQELPTCCSISGTRRMTGGAQNCKFCNVRFGSKADISRSAPDLSVEVVEKGADRRDGFGLVEVRRVSDAGDGGELHVWHLGLHFFGGSGG